MILIIISFSSMSRPVLSMSFYQKSDPNFLAPYSSMIIQAVNQRKQQQESHEKIISTVFDQLSDAVDHFFPKQEEKTEVLWKHRPHSGPYTYNKQYFQHIQMNLNAINAYLQKLQQQARQSR